MVDLHRCRRGLNVYISLARVIERIIHLRSCCRGFEVGKQGLKTCVAHPFLSACIVCDNVTLKLRPDDANIRKTFQRSCSAKFCINPNARLILKHLSTYGGGNRYICQSSECFNSTRVQCNNTVSVVYQSSIRYLNGTNGLNVCCTVKSQHSKESPSGINYLTSSRSHSVYWSVASVPLVRDSNRQIEKHTGEDVLRLFFKWCSRSIYNLIILSE